MSNNKEINLKEKFKQALTSTARAISDDFSTKKENDGVFCRISLQKT